MPWRKNGARCPSCNSPVSRKIPLAEATLPKQRQVKRRKLVFYASNRLVKVDGETRCQMCSSYVCYITSKAQTHQSKRYIAYNGQSLCYASLAEEGWQVYQELCQLGLTKRNLTEKNFVPAANHQQFVPYWEFWLERVELVLEPDIKLRLVLECQN